MTDDRDDNLPDETEDERQAKEDEAPKEPSPEERARLERAYAASQPPRPKTEGEMTFFKHDPSLFQGYGDGKSGCSLCRGKGVVDLPPNPAEGRFVPATRKCTCILARDILANAEKGWPGLTKAPKVPASVLLGNDGRNLWITADTSVLKAHLRHVALRMGPNWDFLVTSDADLMTAWLASVVVEGKDILDPDSAKSGIEYFRLEDLVVPPALLVIVLGIKTARNKALPEVLLETLRLRSYRDRATWIVDQPTDTGRFGHGHLAFSEAVFDEVKEWPRATLAGAGGGTLPPAEQLPGISGGITLDGPEEDDTLSGRAPVGTTARVAQVEAKVKSRYGMGALTDAVEEDAFKKSKPGKKPRRDRA